MEGYEIFRAICRAFQFGHEPYVCDPGADIQKMIGHHSDFIRPVSWTRHHLIEICFVTSILTLLIGLLIVKVFTRNN